LLLAADFFSSREQPGSDVVQNRARMPASPRPAQLRRRRATAQRLVDRPSTTPAELVGHLLCVQAQDPRAARLGLRARSTGMTLAAIDAAITEERSIVLTWLQRGTIHLAAREDLPWLHGLTAPTTRNANLRRLGQEAFPEPERDRAVAAIRAALADRGPLSRNDLAEVVARAVKRPEGQAMPHLLLYLSLRGELVRGPVRPGGQDWALARDWLGEELPARLEGEERERALAELARRYLVAHGPATEADLSWWAGLPLRDVRAGLGAIASELQDLGGGLVALAGVADGGRRKLPTRLLPAFDAWILGWKDRTFALAPEHVGRVQHGGIIRGTVVVGGTIVGTWGTRRDERRLRVDVDRFEVLGERTEAALRREAEEVAAFEGRELVLEAP
jgi:DNA glycosylase AlkZ-like